MLPALISTMASTGNSCSAETLRRIASKIGSNDSLLRCRPRSTSCTITSRSRPFDLDGERRARACAEMLVAAFDGGSMSCG